MKNWNIWWLLVGLAGLINTALAEDVLLVFTAEWCKPCQRFKEDLAADPTLVGNYTVDMFDLDAAKDIAQDFDVETVPTFIVVKVDEDSVIKKTNVVKRHAGYTGPVRFKRWLDR